MERYHGPGMYVRCGENDSTLSDDYIGCPNETVLRSRGRDSPTNQIMTRRTTNVLATEFRFILDSFVDHYCLIFGFL